MQKFLKELHTKIDSLESDKMQMAQAIAALLDEVSKLRDAHERMASEFYCPTYTNPHWKDNEKDLATAVEITEDKNV